MCITCSDPSGADNVSPVISNVPSSQYYYTTNNGFSATWVEPTATDNSGTANLVRRTYTSGSFFPLGTTAVTYVFSDPSNNAATATFFVTVIQCKFLIRSRSKMSRNSLVLI